MASIINNGESITIKTTLPIVGMIAVTDYLNTVGGENGTVAYFERKIRWAYDGINYTEWRILNKSTIELLQPKKYDLLTFELEYIKRGNIGDVTELTFSDFTLLGTFSDPLMSDFYKNLPFSTFLPNWWNDINTLGWCVSVLEKLFKNGVLAEYIDRKQNLDREDEDFFQFWRSVCQFFGLIVSYGRAFENYFSDSVLFQEYLRQKGLYA